MQAVILAGGLGTRLRSLVGEIPKPMTRFGDKPFLEHLLDGLKAYQIREVIICVGYLHKQIVDYFGDGSRWGVRVQYSIEENLLGTAGAIKHAGSSLGKTFMVFNGDTFFELDLDRFIAFHDKKKTSQPENYLGTLALTSVENGASYGSVTLNGEDLISRFQEKLEKRPEQPGAVGVINAGVYILERAILEFIPYSQKVSIERETFPMVLEQNHSLGGYLVKGTFIDIGTPAGYYQYQSYLQESFQ